MAPRSLHLVLREWLDPARWEEAARRHPGAAGVDLAVARLSEREQERTSEHWFEAPRRVREERGSFVAVRDGDRWTLRTPQGAEHSGQDPPGSPATATSQVLSLLDPSTVLAQLDVDERGMGERAGRPVVILRATPGADADLAALHPLELYADAWELERDAEHGTLLAARSLLDGRPFSLFEAVRAEFDAALGPHLFSGL